MELYELSDTNIWSDTYIREQLLSAHLDPVSDAASRRPSVIDATVNWVLKNHHQAGSLVDLGCGPGLYAEKFAAKNWCVTGIDINRSSIQHAQATSDASSSRVHYLEGSYLTEIPKGPFDLATCIYCDFGALTPDQRVVFLQNVYQALDSKGELIFDVFGNGICEHKSEGRSWSREERGNFWSHEPCYVLSECQHFAEECVWGEKYIVFPDVGSPFSAVVWTHYFTPAELSALLSNAGFEIMEKSTDLISQSNFVTTDVMFVRCRKT